MPRLTHKVPSLRLHKASGRAVVALGGKDIYLGPYGSTESQDQYRRVIGEWLANQKQGGSDGEHYRHDLTVVELISSYWRHVETYYVKDGKPTSEPDTIRQALRFVRRLYEQTAARDFGPLALK